MSPIAVVSVKLRPRSTVAADHSKGKPPGAPRGYGACGRSAATMRSTLRGFLE